MKMWGRYRGEYHTMCLDGPLYASPLRVQLLVKKTIEYPYIHEFIRVYADIYA